MRHIPLGICAALLACPTFASAQDTTAGRSQAELAREADSTRAAYTDSVAEAERLGTAGRLARAPRSPLEFRGHRLGDQPWTKKKCNKDKAETVCPDPDDRIGDAKVTIAYVFTNDRLTTVGILFRSEDYEQLARAFAAKFGPSDSTWSSEVQNRMGAKFENTYVAWTDTSATLLLRRYSGSLNSGMGVLTSKEALRASRQEEDAAAQRAKRDL